MHRFLWIAGALASMAVAQDKPVFSESFESGKIDPAVWDRRVAGEATAAVEEVEGAHGKYALHIHYPDMARGSYAFLVATHLPDAVKTHAFGRAYMRISPGVGTTHNPLMFAGEPGWPLSKFQEIGTSRGMWMPSYQENKSLAGQGRGEITYRANSAPPMDQWFLVEWEFSDDPSFTRMWVNGEKVTIPRGEEKVDVVKFVWPKESTNDKGIVGGYAEFGFGARVWGAPPKGFDVWYDDIAIGTARIGAVK